MITSKLAQLRANLPTPMEGREILCPEEVPGYDDYLRFGSDPWRQIGPSLYVNGPYALIWAGGDPDHGLLLWGERARQMIARSESLGPRPAGAGR